MCDGRMNVWVKGVAPLPTQWVEWQANAGTTTVRASRPLQQAQITTTTAGMVSEGFLRLGWSFYFASTELPSTRTRIL